MLRHCAMVRRLRLAAIAAAASFVWCSVAPPQSKPESADTCQHRTPSFDGRLKHLFNPKFSGCIGPVIGSISAQYANLNASGNNAGMPLTLKDQVWHVDFGLSYKVTGLR